MLPRIIISRSNPIDPDPRVEKEAQTLAAHGYDVRVIAWDRSASLPVKDKIGQIIINRIKIRAEYGHGIGNLPTLLRWQASLFAWLIENRKSYEIIHACDFDTVLPALFIKLFLHKKIVYDIFDFYADHLRRTPKLIKKIIRIIDLWVMSEVDATILVDDARRVQVQKAKLSRPSVVIYNSPIETEIQAQYQPQNSPFRIAYIGILQIERGLLEILEIMQRHPEWRLDLAGFGGDENIIVEKARQISNVTWYGRIPYEQALAISIKADTLFATYDPIVPNHRFSSPNKVFEAMMLAKPLIVTRNTNMDKIVIDTDCGIVIDYGDIQQLESALTNLANNPDLRARLGKNARKAYDTKFGWHIMQKRLLDLYATL